MLLQILLTIDFFKKSVGNSYEESLHVVEHGMLARLLNGLIYDKELAIKDTIGRDIRLNKL